LLSRIAKTRGERREEEEGGEGKDLANHHRKGKGEFLGHMKDRWDQITSIYHLRGEKKGEEKDPFEKTGPGGCVCDINPQEKRGIINRCSVSRKGGGGERNGLGRKKKVRGCLKITLEGRIPEYSRAEQI